MTDEERVARFLAGLDLRRTGDGEFAAALEDFGEGRAFGGEIVAHAAMAAARTVAGRDLHSLHAYFLRPGRTDQPTKLVVTAVRDGRSYANRRVSVMQGAHLICEAAVSFASPAAGSSYQDDRPDAPDPDTIATFRAVDAWGEPPGPFEWRMVEDPWRPHPQAEPSRWRAWLRPFAPLPDDPLVHMAAIVYASDFGSLGAVQQRHGASFDWSGSASLDHAFWLHRPVRWNDWLLLTTENRFAFGGRAMTYRHIHTCAGDLIASVSQEGLFRTRAD